MRRNDHGRRGGPVGLLRAVAAVLALAVVAGCGVEGGQAADLDRPAPSGWRRLTLCSQDGPVTVSIPRGVEFDGPRPPANLTDPAVVTYAWGYTPDRQIRHDVFVVTDVGHYGETDREIARTVVKLLNGAPGMVRIRSMEDREDRAVGGFDERYDSRDYRFRFVSSGGTVVALGVGVHDGATGPIVRRAKAELAEMWRTLDVAGLDGAPTGHCTGPKDEPG
jgi:hypothetical protein